MSTHPHVPADDEATSLVDLVDDCREVAGVLAPYLPVGVSLPVARPAAPLEIDLQASLAYSDL